MSGIWKLRLGMLLMGLFVVCAVLFMSKSAQNDPYTRGIYSGGAEIAVVHIAPPGNTFGNGSKTYATPGENDNVICGPVDHNGSLNLIVDTQNNGQQKRYAVSVPYDTSNKLGDPTIQGTSQKTC